MMQICRQPLINTVAKILTSVERKQGKQTDRQTDRSVKTVADSKQN